MQFGKWQAKRLKNSLFGFSIWQFNSDTSKKWFCFSFSWELCFLLLKFPERQENLEKKKYLEFLELLEITGCAFDPRTLQKGRVAIKKKTKKSGRSSSTSKFTHFSLIPLVTTHVVAISWGSSGLMAFVLCCYRGTTPGSIKAWL